MDDQATTRAKGDRNACLRCGAQLDSMGVEEFRIGGTTGGWKLLFGEWAELGEGKLQLEVRACTTCRTVDLRVPERYPDGAAI
jgi:hypothetical protein